MVLLARMTEKVSHPHSSALYFVRDQLSIYSLDCVVLVGGKRYFSCPPERGVFVRPSKAVPLGVNEGRLPAIGTGNTGRRFSAAPVMTAAKGRKSDSRRPNQNARRNFCSTREPYDALGGYQRSGTVLQARSGRLGASTAPPLRHRQVGVAARTHRETSDVLRRRREHEQRTEAALDRARESALLQLDMMGRQRPAMPWEVVQDIGGRSGRIELKPCSPIVFGMPELEAGDKVVLPASVLERLLRTSVNMQTMLDPMLFRLSPPSGSAGGPRSTKHVVCQRVYSN